MNRHKQIPDITMGDVLLMHQLGIGFTLAQLRRTVFDGTLGNRQRRQLATRALNAPEKFQQMWRHAEAQGWFHKGRVVVIGEERFEA